MRRFNRLYEAYKLNFDLELSLYLTKTTYRKMEETALKDEEWL